MDRRRWLVRSLAFQWIGLGGVLHVFGYNVNVFVSQHQRTMQDSGIGDTDDRMCKVVPDMHNYIHRSCRLAFSIPFQSSIFLLSHQPNQPNQPKPNPRNR